VSQGAGGTNAVASRVQCVFVILSHDHVGHYSLIMDTPQLLTLYVLVLFLTQGRLLLLKVREAFCPRRRSHSGPIEL